MKKNRDKKQRGLLTLDFIFSFMVTWGMMMVFLLMSFTLMMSSVSQYIIFATNRAHISGHITEEEQRLVGTTKFEILSQSFGDSLSTGTQSWFRVEIIDADPVPEDFGNTANQWKYGYKLTYTASILKNSKFPIIGGPGDGAENANFGQATLKAYMYREPSTEECLNFNNDRWNKILERFENLDGSYITGSDSYGSTADNGC